MLHLSAKRHRHHVEPRVKLYSPREESFPVPLKYIDVTRTTQTNLDVKQEKLVDDYWNIDGSRDLPDPWTRFTFFILLEEKPPNGFLWSGERQTRKQLTSRPDSLWPELWTKLGRNAQLKERQKWSHEKLHLDSNQNLRVFWKPVRENLYRIIMKTILQEKETIHYSITIWFTNLFLCLKLRKFLQRKQRWTRNGKNWRKFRRGT